MRKYGWRYEALLLKMKLSFPSVLKKDRWEWDLVLSSHDRKGERCKRMNGTGKEKSCRGEGGLLLLLIFL